MKTILCLLVLAFFCSGWAVAAAALHVVHTPGTISVLTKQNLGFGDTYVDTRHWTGHEDLAAHPHLARRLVQLGRADLVGHAVDLDDPHLVAALRADERQVQPRPAAARINVDLGW